MKSLQAVPSDSDARKPSETRCIRARRRRRLRPSRVGTSMRFMALEYRPCDLWLRFAVDGLLPPPATTGQRSHAGRLA